MAKRACYACKQLIEYSENFCPYCGTSTSTMPKPISQGATLAIFAKKENGKPADKIQKRENRIKGKRGKGIGWIALVRIFCWIFLAVMLIGSLIFGIGVAMSGWTDSGILDILCGIAALAVGVLISFWSVASGMIALNNAENLRRIAINTEKTVEILSKE